METPGCAATPLGSCTVPPLQTAAQPRPRATGTLSLVPLMRLAGTTPPSFPSRAQPPFFTFLQAVTDYCTDFFLLRFMGITLRSGILLFAQADLELAGLLFMRPFRDVYEAVAGSFLLAPASPG